MCVCVIYVYVCVCVCVCVCDFVHVCVNVLYTMINSTCHSWLCTCVCLCVVHEATNVCTCFCACMLGLCDNRKNIIIIFHDIFTKLSRYLILL